MKVCSRLAFLCVNASEIGSLIGTALIDDWCYVETDKVGADTILEAKSIFHASLRMGKGVFFASAGELLITAQQQATMSFWPPVYGAERRKGSEWDQGQQLYNLLLID